MNLSNIKIVGALFALIFCYCSSDSGTNSSSNALDNLSIKASPLTLLTGEISSLSVVARDIEGSELSYMWSSSTGQLSSTSGSSVQWTAPGTPGTFEITVTVSDGGNSTEGRITLVVATLPELVFVDAGSFEMGNNFEEGPPDARPVHSVFVDAFYIGRYEVTNAQYAAFLNKKGNQIEGVTTWYNEYSIFAKIDSVDAQYIPVSGFEDHPVMLVTWYGAKAFCDWLVEKTGDSYRLPTEAEWEKAARGDDRMNQSEDEFGQIVVNQRAFPWGNTISGRYANYLNSGDPFEPDTTPVGFFDGSIRNGFPTKDGVSPYGVYDMVGNVSEWCNDWYARNYYRNSPSTNPMGPSTGTNRVRRGGSWGGTFENLFSFNRTQNFPGSGLSYTGFRVSRN